MPRKVRIELTKDEARALAILAQRSFNQIEEGGHRWRGRKESLRVLAKVQYAAFGAGWTRRADR